MLGWEIGAKRINIPKRCNNRMLPDSLADVSLIFLFYLSVCLGKFLVSLSDIQYQDSRFGFAEIISWPKFPLEKVASRRSIRIDYPIILSRSAVNLFSITIARSEFERQNLATCDIKMPERNRMHSVRGSNCVREKAVTQVIKPQVIGIKKKKKRTRERQATRGKCRASHTGLNVIQN